MTGHMLFLIFWVVFIIYYSFWLLVSPFLDEDQPLQNLFPPRTLGILMSDVWICCVIGFCMFAYGWYVYFGEAKSLLGKYSIENEILKRQRVWLAHHKATSLKQARIESCSS